MFNIPWAEISGIVYLYMVAKLFDSLQSRGPQKPDQSRKNTMFKDTDKLPEHIRKFMLEHFRTEQIEQMERINALPNGAEKTALIEEFGVSNYWKALGAHAVQEDQCGTLFRLEPETRTALLRVTNSTPEPDGSFRGTF